MKSWKKVLAATVVVVGALAFLCRGRSTGEAPVASVAKQQDVSRTSAASASAGAPATPFVMPTNQTASVRGTKPFVLQSEVKFQKSLRLAAEALGARTIGVLSPKRLLVEANAETCRRLRADPRFSGLSEYLPTSKVEAALLAALKGGAQTVEASIVALAETDRARVVDCVKAGGGEILTGCLNERDLIRARVSSDLVATLVARGDVRWLETFDRPHLMNDVAVNPEAMNVRPAWFSAENPQGLSGEGQRISTSDSGIDTGDTETMHEDLRNQVLAIKVVEGCSTNDVSGHGTHTAGSILGDGTLSMDPEAYPGGPIRGTAWGAKLYAWFCGSGGSGISTPPTSEELFRGDETGTEWADAYIHSASWGSNTAGAYNSRCVRFDEYLWEHADFLPVVSAGNEGPARETVGSPGAAKNVLAVGATLNLSSGDPSQTASFSSRGPCADGRIKPDISAPGSYVLSTRSSLTSGSGYYTRMQGTSMACPLTAGSVALVREWLCKRDEYQSEPPTAAMMKAVITGGAKGAAEPNNDQGWGRVDLTETLYPSNRAVRLIDRIPFGEGDEFYYVVETTNAAPLDVQLAWVDAPGIAGSAKALVNDLDLTVEPLYGDGDVLLGNGGETADTLNNLESVHIDEAPTNRYLITVCCSTIMNDYTEGGAAALYIRGAFDPAKTLEDETEGRVRIKGKTNLFMSLDSALRVAEAGDEIEVLAPTRLKARRTIAADIKISATNENPAASAVTVAPSAELVVGDSATLVVSNIVFKHDGKRTVDVLTNGVLWVEQRAALDEIRLAEEKCFVLAASPSYAVTVDAPFATTNGAVFGRCAAPSVENAAYLFNKYDEESAGERTPDGLSLRWGNHPEVPLEAAYVRMESATGGKIGYRSLNVLFKYCPTPTGAVAVAKSGPLTNCLTRVDYDLFLYGDGENVVVTPSSTARFVMPKGGSLVISNLTFRGYTGPRLFQVDGGEMTLAYGARLEELATDKTATDPGGVTVLNAGELTLLPGASIVNCRANGYGVKAVGCYGGGIYVNSGHLRILGGRISDCYAAKGGGGVYVTNDESTRVDFEGDVRIFGNSCPSEGNENVNTYYPEDGTHLFVTGPLSDSANVGLGWTETYDDPMVFATVEAELTEEELKTAAHAFVCDSDEELYAKYAEYGASTKLVWEERENDGQVDPAQAYDLVIYGYGTAKPVTNYYDSVEAAFKYAKKDCTIVMLTNESFAADIKVGYKIDLISESDNGVSLYRGAECSVIVPRDKSLMLDGVVVYGTFSVDGIWYGGSNALIKVEGGSLTLKSGSGVRDASAGNGDDAAAGVVVSVGGKFTMESGSFIVNCGNQWEGLYGKESELGRGGGLRLDYGTAYLKGGTITRCWAAKGGGVYLANASKAYVSGGFTVDGNIGYDEAEDEWGRRSDVEFDGDSQIVLVDELTGSVGIARGTTVTAFGTNAFGKVEYDGSLTNLIESAAMFYRDEEKTDHGVIVTNKVTDAPLLVWATALKGEEGGKYYVDDDGVTNWLVVVSGPTPGPTPSPTPPSPTPPEVVVTNFPSAIAFKSIGRLSETEWLLVVTDRVEHCRYRLLSTDDLAKGFVTTGDWAKAEADGAWETNVTTSAGQKFWKAEATWGIVPKDE